MWTIEDISFEMVDDMTDDPVVTVRVTTPLGRLDFAAEVIAENDGRKLILGGLHVQEPAPGSIGQANLRTIVRAAMERMKLDGLDVEGAVRTTGSRPGRLPGVLRFSRRVPPPPSSGPSGA